MDIDSKKEEDWVRKLADVMRRLRSPEGCPWDREQTHSTLKKCLIEECAELLDAIDEENPDNVCEELGDILMHIVFHSAIAEENGHFNLDEVARISVEKMIRRHPHVFGDESVSSSGEVVDLWEEVKKKEKKDKKQQETALSGIPFHMPSLMKAEKIQKKAAKYGFDWSQEIQILEKIEEEVAELRHAMESGDSSHIDEEIGDLLFSVANLTRFRKGASAEELLAATVRKFKNRFEYIEKSLKEKNIPLEEASIDEMEKLWNEAKTAGIN